MKSFVVFNISRMVLGIIARVILSITILVLFTYNNSIAEDKPSTKNLKKTTELKARNISSPKKFCVQYQLKDLSSCPKTRLAIRKAASSASTKESSVYAEVAVNILGKNFRPLRTYVLRKVENTENVVTLWDGRDSYGREMPAGDYYAQLSIVYSDDKKETKCYKFTKE